MQLNILGYGETILNQRFFVLHCSALRMKVSCYILVFLVVLWFKMRTVSSDTLCKRCMYVPIHLFLARGRVTGRRAGVHYFCLTFTFMSPLWRLSISGSLSTNPRILVVKPLIARVLAREAVSSVLEGVCWGKCAMQALLSCCDTGCGRQHNTGRNY